MNMTSSELVFLSVVTQGTDYLRFRPTFSSLPINSSLRSRILGWKFIVHRLCNWDKCQHLHFADIRSAKLQVGGRYIWYECEWGTSDAVGILGL